MCIRDIVDLVTTAQDAALLPVLFITLVNFWEYSRVLSQADTCLNHRHQCTNITLLTTLTETKIYSGSFNNKWNQKCQIPSSEMEKQSLCHPPSTSAHQPLSYLQLQEGDVEELVQVLEAKAVLHGRLSIAKIRGAGRPVSTREVERTALYKGCRLRTHLLNYTPWTVLISKPTLGPQM